jgi:anti-sigma B factor antagonist
MAQMVGKTDVRTRRIDDATCVLEVHGEVTAASEKALTDGYGEASTPATRAVIVDFTALEYMNSGGIGLLVTMLVRANRQKQRLLAYGLNDHYRQIFELTRLDEAIGIHGTEQEAVSAAKG